MDFGGEVLKIADEGLKKRGRLDKSGNSEQGFLEVLWTVLEKGKSPADELLDRYAQFAKGDIGDFLEWQGDLKHPILNIAQAKDKTHLIKRLKYSTDSTGRPIIQIELHDPLQAMGQLSKALGLDKLELGDKTTEVLLKVLKGVSLDEL